MIDLEHLRHNPDLYRKAIKQKRIDLDLTVLLAQDAAVRDLRRQVDGLRAERNRISARVAAGTLTRDEASLHSRTFSERLELAEKELKGTEHAFAKLTALLPGLPAPDVPEGDGDEDNVELYRRGKPAVCDFAQRDHVELATLHGMVDFEAARQAAGSRAYALLGAGVLLEQALLRFAFDLVIGRGFTPVAPPLMVREQAMFGTGYFPLGEDNAYQLRDDDLYLTGTSEVGIMAMQAGRLLEVDKLPLRYVGMTTCFRSEAGSAGRDVKGLYRVHQFQKVEQIVIGPNDVESSRQAHGEILQNAEDILQALELPYRVVAVCAGDMGLGQVRKNDIETWMPSRKAYGETHSCSTFHDFQARRLNLRYRDASGQKHYVHTLNNTAIASPRILIAFLENHQQKDGTIYIPPALRPYLSGRTAIQ
ncbi:MAG: serine--tRNA ligase [Cyanobacteria bacterium REEB67]|nr:serine--tRNA ligase [Cyanobacteria bacterium REEB67]